MKHLLSFIAALGLLVTPFGLANAQVVQAVTVASCGTPPNTPIVGGTYPVLMDTTGKLCTSGSGGGGGGGAITAASGAIVDLGPYTTANTTNYYLAGLYNGTSPGSSLPIYYQGSTAVAAIQADSTAFINPTTATTTQIVGFVSGKKIYITSFDVVASSANTVNFSYGTGTNCATGLTAISATWSFAANGGISRGNGQGPVIVVPAGNSLCVTTGQSGQTGIDVSYAQF